MITTVSERTKIREYIFQNLTKLDDEVDFSDQDNIFQIGIVNSLFAMKLLVYIENEFQITIDDSEVEIVNFSSIDNMMKLIERKRGCHD
jgi:methoxymalonate biosynthesis acyl carrier protein